MSQKEVATLLFQKLLDKFEKANKKFVVFFNEQEIQIIVYLYNQGWEKEARLEYTIEADGTITFNREEGGTLVQFLEGLAVAEI